MALQVQDAEPSNRLNPFRRSLQLVFGLFCIVLIRSVHRCIETTVVSAEA